MWILRREGGGGGRAWVLYPSGPSSAFRQKKLFNIIELVDINLLGISNQIDIINFSGCFKIICHI